jgi:hypothetical protein
LPDESLGSVWRQLVRLTPNFAVSDFQAFGRFPPKGQPDVAQIRGKRYMDGAIIKILHTEKSLRKVLAQQSMKFNKHQKNIFSL